MTRKLQLFSPPNQESDAQYIRFVERDPVGESRALVTRRNGTTIRDVLKVCKEELTYLNEILPCEENLQAIAHVDEAIGRLNKREFDRKQRGVEGFHLP